MSPSALLNLSGDTMQQHARHGMASQPMAAPGERRWATVVCVLTMVLAAAAIFVMR